MTADELHAAEMEARENGESGREALDARIKTLYFAKPLQITVRATAGTQGGEPIVSVTCVKPMTQHFDLTLGDSDEERGQHRVATSLVATAKVTTSCRASRWPAVRRAEVEVDSDEQDSEAESWRALAS